MEAIILAGGLGTRLRDTVPDLPKPMAPINGKPFLEYQLEWLSKYDIKKIVLSTGFMADKISSYFGNEYNGIPLEYSIETTPLGTGGAIAYSLQKTSGKNVLVVNGDTWFPINIKDFLSFHKKLKSDISLALKRMTNFSRYGTVDLEKETILHFNEKKKCEEGLINGGIYLLNKRVFDNIDKSTFSFEKEILEKRSESGYIKGMIFDSPFIDIGIPEDYEKATLLMTSDFSSMKNKALFLARDGVVIIDTVHVHKIEDFEFTPDIFKLTKRYQDNGFLIIIITNQAGIAKGLYTEEDFDILTKWMIEEFR
ncbi:MAG: NTP transferase domain-containing protein, partial [Bacteroidales bacterium]|nr:NTP transferase domain-containing protein [Bacteroidales bacterium]